MEKTENREKKWPIYKVKEYGNSEFNTIFFYNQPHFSWRNIQQGTKMHLSIKKKKIFFYIKFDSAEIFKKMNWTFFLSRIETRTSFLLE